MGEEQSLWGEGEGQEHGSKEHRGTRGGHVWWLEAQTGLLVWGMWLDRQALSKAPECPVVVKPKAVGQG